MFNNEFKSRLIMSKDVVIGDSNAVKEFKFIFEDSNPSQTFLSSLGVNIYHPFVSDIIEWNVINFKTNISHVSIKFDALNLLNCTIMNIKCTRKECKNEEKYIYEITVHKSCSQDVDDMFVYTYLKRKELNKDSDKLEFVLYNTTFTK